MYQFTGKLKMLAIALIVLGVVGTVYSFLSVPTKAEAKVILEAQAAHHGNSHASDDTHHDDVHKEDHKEGAHKETTHANDTHKEDHKGEAHQEAAHTTEAHVDSLAHKTVAAHKEVKETKHAAPAHKADGAKHSDAHQDDDHHLEHALHQMQNRPWSAFYVSMLFFLGVTLLVFAFYASQRVAQAGWSVALFRVMEAITNNLHYVSAIALVFFILTAMHMNHLFPWMAEGTFDPQHANYDAVVDGKKWFLNIPGWMMRTVFYLLGWNVFRYIIRKKSIEQDNGDLKLHKRLFNINVGFVFFFMITESMMSWDWIMGIDPHWFSTLFGWYVLATFLVSALTVIAFVTIYLRSKGALPMVNDSHIHDLAKFMFGFSVFWTYLWFAQFMLIWYADIPEETTYFAQRFNEYKLPFLAMVVMNFVFPVLLLLNSDFKSIPWFVLIGGIVILIGHYIDLFVMIMPGTVGAQWGFGIGELSGFLLFLGIFIYATFSAFAKADPVVKGSPFLHESETHHYYNIEHRGEDNNGHH